MNSSRDRILDRIRAAQQEREGIAHPGAFEGWRPTPPPADPVAGFTALFTEAGGEVIRLTEDAARHHVGEAAARAGSVSVGEQVPPQLTPDAPRTAPESAALGVSMAVGAVADTGSLVLDARDGRRTQLLPPTHLVLVRASDVHASLDGALQALSADLPSALGLHSGPSKSADIGQILVKGVHGPGRVIALILDD